MKTRFKLTLIFSLLIISLFCFQGTIFAGKPYKGKPVKYVFLMIGDGMGIPQRMATESFINRKLVMDTFPAQGLTRTKAADRFITGSAASATALACGKKTNINFIGVDTNLKSLKNMSEYAKQQGKKVGIISSVSIDHATPAAFYAHVKHRSMYHEIDIALAKSGFDFFGGGGLKDPKGKKSKKPLGDAIAIAKRNGYRFVDNKRDFMSLRRGSGKIISTNAWLQDSQALPYAMDMRRDDITLAQFTEKAIELLDNKKGFFIMVEGGKIDWACHANDAAASIKNNVAFDDSVKVVFDFYKKHKDETLIVVTGDHECGGLTLGFAGTKYSSNYEILKNQKVSFQKFSDDVVIPYTNKNRGFNSFKHFITEYFGLKFHGNSKNDYMVLKDNEIEKIRSAFNMTMRRKYSKDNPDEYILYGDYDPLTITLTHIMSQKAGLGWTSYKHTGVPVSTSAVGKGSNLFNGYYDNTDVANRILLVMGIK